MWWFCLCLQLLNLQQGVIFVVVLSLPPAPQSLSCMVWSTKIKFTLIKFALSQPFSIPIVWSANMCVCDVCEYFLYIFHFCQCFITFHFANLSISHVYVGHLDWWWCLVFLQLLHLYHCFIFGMGLIVVVLSLPPAPQSLGVVDCGGFVSASSSSISRCGLCGGFVCASSSSISIGVVYVVVLSLPPAPQSLASGLCGGVVSVSSSSISSKVWFMLSLPPTLESLARCGYMFQLVIFSTSFIDNCVICLCFWHIYGGVSKVTPTCQPQVYVIHMSMVGKFHCGVFLSASSSSISIY